MVHFEVVIVQRPKGAIIYLCFSELSTTRSLFLSIVFAAFAIEEKGEALSQKTFFFFALYCHIPWLESVLSI